MTTTRGACGSGPTGSGANLSGGMGPLPKRALDDYRLRWNTRPI